MPHPGELAHRLLLAHPEPETRDQLAEHLTYLGLDVVGRVSSGLEALAMASLHRPDLLLAGAELEGRLTASMARALADRYGIPSVVFGGSEGVFDHGREPRPYVELRSPFGLDDLEAAVHAVLTRPLGSRGTAPAPNRVVGGGERLRLAGLASPSADARATVARGVWLRSDRNGDGTEEPEFRSWSRCAMKAVEEERLRIARELHDDLAQRLATHQVHVQMAQTTSGERRSALLEEVRAGLEESSDVVRRVIRGLRPASLSETELPTALRTDVREWMEETDVELVLAIDPMPTSLPAPVQLCLYRIGQEAVNNAIRHADPDTIVVRLTEDGGTIELSVRDDGCGIDPDRVGETGNRFGLVGMCERAGAVGGEVRIESSAGAGTLIRAEVPFRG